MTYSYSYYDLGDQQHDRWVVARLSGSAANVILLDVENFDRYRNGRSFAYLGGFTMQASTRLQIPRAGHWYLVVDCGGYRTGICVDKVEVLTSEQLAEAEAERTPVGATA